MKVILGLKVEIAPGLWRYGKIGLSGASVRGIAATQQFLGRMRRSRFRPIVVPAGGAGGALAAPARPASSGGVDRVVAALARATQRFILRRRCRLLPRLAIDDEGNVGAAQAQIREGAVVEGVQFGKSALALAPRVKAADKAAEEISQCRHDTAPFE